MVQFRRSVVFVFICMSLFFCMSLVAAAPVPLKPPAQPSWQDFQMADALHGWAIRDGQVYRTGNGALGWVRLPPLPERASAVRIILGASWNQAIFIGRTGNLKYTLYAAEAGGRRWRKLSILPGAPTEPLPLSDTVFRLNPNEMWWNVTLGSVANTAVSSLYRTRDAGRHWTLLNFNGLTGGPLKPTGLGLHASNVQSNRIFTTSRHGLFASSSLVAGLLNIHSTDDAGYTWHTRSLPLRNSRDMADEPRLFLFGQAAVVVVGVIGETAADPPALQTFVSLDAGRTWRVRPPLAIRLKNLYRDQAVTFSTLNTGWADLGGSLYRTTNGGEQWMKLAAAGLPAHGNVRSIQLFAQTGWLSTGAGLYKTFDGGLHWHLLNARQ